MRRTKSAPSLRKRSKSRSRKKLNRTRSAPKRISTSKKKRSKKRSKNRSKKRSKPRMVRSIVPRSIPQLDWRVAHPDQHSRLLEAQKNRSIVPPSIPQLDWRVAHPDQHLAPTEKSPHDLVSFRAELVSELQKQVREEHKFYNPTFYNLNFSHISSIVNL